MIANLFLLLNCQTCKTKDFLHIQDGIVIVEQSDRGNIRKRFDVTFVHPRFRFLKARLCRFDK